MISYFILEVSIFHFIFTDSSIAVVFHQQIHYQYDTGQIVRVQSIIMHNFQ